MTRGRFSHFSPKALSFLRALKRHNDREWFRARKDQYELLLRAPMIGLIQRLAGDLRTFAPNSVANPPGRLRGHRLSTVAGLLPFGSSAAIIC